MEQGGEQGRGKEKAADVMPAASFVQMTDQNDRFRRSE
jgi:hypothetical protein